MSDKKSLERSKSKAEKHKVKAEDETNIKPGILRQTTEPVRSRKPKDSSEENLRHKKHSESSKTSSSAKREHRSSRKSSDHDRSHRSTSANPRISTPEHHKKHRSVSEHRHHHEHENPEDEKNCEKCQRRRLKRAQEALKMGHTKPKRKEKEKEKEKKKTKPSTTNPPAATSVKKPERRLTCIACLDDELPRNKVVHLTCGHYFCHTCLRRLFKLSLTDPAHMPPKCCTSDHIPLKHVEKLLSDQTKQLWNKKYKEFTTKNRIYCPVPNCGEWIPPEAIRKKVGKCSKCKTKVCAMCNAKAHGKEECPKDPELLKFLDAAHENKYQRCYNCKRFVELDKGCNHMTCPCTAEFCYICGSQWKTCDCPILNAEPDDDDAEPGQAGAFQLPFGLGNLFGFARNNVVPARPGPRNALERQIWEDELLARQLADEEERDAMPQDDERIRVVDAGTGREAGGIRNGIRSLAAAQEGVYSRPPRAPLPPVTTNTAATGRVVGGQSARASSTAANNPVPTRGGSQTARTSSTSASNPAPVREGRATGGQTARASSTAANNPAPVRGGSQTGRISATPATNPAPAREGRVASSQTARTSTTPATNPAPVRENKARKERRSRKEEVPPPALPPRKKIPQTTTTTTSTTSTTKPSRAHSSSNHHHHHTHTSAGPAITEALKSPTTAPAPAAPERRGLFGSLFGGFATQSQDHPEPTTASSPQQQDPPRSRYLSDNQQNTVDTFLNSLPDKPPAPGEPAKASATSGSHPAPQRQRTGKKSGHTRSHTSSMARDFMLWTAGGSTKRRS